MGISKKQFESMQEGEKASYVLTNGRQITTKKKGENYANLFSVDDLLVEVWYDSEKNKILSINIVEDSDVIDSYIDSARPGD
jgi:hypothetical protein